MRAGFEMGRYCASAENFSAKQASVERIGRPDTRRLRAGPSCAPFAPRRRTAHWPGLRALARLVFASVHGVVQGGSVIGPLGPDNGLNEQAAIKREPS